MPRKISLCQSDVQPPAADPQRHVEPATQVLRRFRAVFNAVKTHFTQVEKLAGVGGAQLWALSLIQENPGLGVSGLAAAMDIHQATASNLVRAAMDQGLISSTKGSADRRAKQLWITPQGVAVLHRAPGPFSGVLPEALAALDPETLARLDADLGRLLAGLKSDKRAEGIPLAQI